MQEVWIDLDRKIDITNDEWSLHQQLVETL